MRLRAIPVLLLLPSPALAEVMDKVSTPWEPGRWVPLAIVTAACVVAARRPGRARTLAAFVVAATWAAAGFAFDDLYDPIVGPAIRGELPALHLHAYRLLVPFEALLPLAVVAAALATRVRRGANAP